MPKKRCKKQTIDDGSGAVFEEGNDAKRPKPATSSDKTIQDLPFEMVECILVRAVTMEVLGMKLAKCAWKEKAELVMNRLRTVCSQWNSVITTIAFRNEVHRVLEGTAQMTIRLEILHQFLIQFCVHEVTTLKDEIFVLCTRSGAWNGHDYVINVCERNDVALEVKEVIPLPTKQFIWAMAACSMSNGLYVLMMDCQGGWDFEGHCSVLRIEKDDGHPFKTSTWITDLKLSNPILSVSADGNLIIVSRRVMPNLSVVKVYNADGSLQRKLPLSKDLFGGRWFSNVIQRSNGNLVILSSDSKSGTNLTEIDSKGSTVHQYKSALKPSNGINMSFADLYGRIFITDSSSAIELVDSELNLLRCTGPKLLGTRSPYLPGVHFSCEKNELVRISYSRSGKTRFFTLFRFTED